MGSLGRQKEWLVEAEASRYRLQKRIRELEAEVSRLRPYRDFSMSVYSGILEVIGTGKSISMPWILEQYKRWGCFK